MFAVPSNGPLAVAFDRKLMCIAALAYTYKHTTSTKLFGVSFLMKPFKPIEPNGCQHWRMAIEK